MSDTESTSDGVAPPPNRMHRVWKKNVPFLYDTSISKELEWPSLTVQWMPDVVKPDGGDVSIHRLLYGTHTAGGAQNHLIIAKLAVPLDKADFDESKWDMEREEFGGYGAGRPAKLETEIRINHEDEVHRARYMPQNPIIIASRGPGNDIYIFDYTKHPSEPLNDRFCPQLRLKGHSNEGYGISWSVIKEGHLLTSADDGYVCHWNINARQSAAGEQEPVRKFRGHSGDVEDVAFHPLHEHAFGSVGDDMKLNIWDIRDPRPQLTVIGHTNDVNCISFNPHDEFLLATGSADKTIGIWDMRNMRDKMYTLVHHKNEIFQVAFSPHNETILASSGSDDRVLVWDLSKIDAAPYTPYVPPPPPPQAAPAPAAPANEEDDDDDAEPGAAEVTPPPVPEVLFVHAGHMGKVADFSWNPNQPWTICSSDEFNTILAWEVSAAAISPEHSEDE